MVAEEVRYAREMDAVPLDDDVLFFSIQGKLNMQKAFLLFLLLALVDAAPPQHVGVSKVGTAPVESNTSVEELSSKALFGDALAAAKLSDYFRYDKNNDARWKYWALVAAENGYPPSQFDEYGILGSGDDVVSQQRAFYWLKKSAEGGYLPAVTELKSCFPLGTFEGRKKDCMGQ